MEIGIFSRNISSRALLVFAFAAAACAHQDLRPSGLDSLTTSMTMKDAASPRSPAASPAAGAGAACFFERFKNPELIEIQNAESDSLAMPERVRGQRDKIYDYFKGRIEGYVHPKFQAALASCGDGMCFYEKVYGKAVSGKLAYLFFLKTGMAVSASDAVPSVTSRPSETGAGIADFLFSDAELTMMIEASEAITSPTYSLFVQPSLHTLHKVPVTTLKNGEDASVRAACGFANGATLVLRADCLAGNWQNKLARQDFGLRTPSEQGADVYLHEFGHCVDFNLGGNATYSSRPEWSGLSRLIQPSADGIIHYPWSALAGFVTGYAATSYMEDFAETFSHFRLRPENTKSSVPGKFEFLRKVVFKEKEFTPLGIRIEFATIINAKILDRMNEILMGCIGRPDTGRKPAIYQTPNLASSEIACVETEAVRIASEQFRVFQRTYPEGCLEGESQWISALLVPNAANVSKSMASLENVRKLAVARDLMMASLDPKEAYLEFRKQADAKKLYREALTRNFEKFRANFNAIEGDLATGELKNYLARYDFELVRDSIQTIVIETLKSNSPKVTLLIEKSFQDCLTSARPSQPADLLKRDFKPGPSGPFLTCGRAVQERPLVALVADIFNGQRLQASSRFLEFAVEVAKLDFEDRFRQRTEDEVQKLEKAVLAQAAIRLDLKSTKPIPVDRIMASPVLEREDTCRGVVRKSLYDDVFKKSPLSSLMTYTQSLLGVENAFCELQIDQNAKHRAELEAFRNQAARIVYSLAFKLAPKAFPQDSTVFSSKESPVDVVDPAKDATCVDELSAELPSEPRLAAMLKVPAQAKLVRAGVREVCLNGRYAGRFNWMPSDHFVAYGGIRALGFAQFYTAAPTGGENRAYLYALRRYIELRTAEKLEVKH